MEINLDKSLLFLENKFLVIKFFYYLNFNKFWFIYLLILFPFQKNACLRETAEQGDHPRARQHPLDAPFGGDHVEGEDDGVKAVQAEADEDHGRQGHSEHVEEFE